MLVDQVTSQMALQKPLVRSSVIVRLEVRTCFLLDVWLRKLTIRQ